MKLNEKRPILAVWCLLFGVVVNNMEQQLFSGAWYAILLLVIAIVLIISTLVMISRQPIAQRESGFSVPFNPWLPGVSILGNIYLMLQLDLMTWVRFMVWIAIGLCIYFGYGIWHSKERPAVKRKLLANGQAGDEIAAMTTSRDLLVIKDKNSL